MDLINKGLEKIKKIIVKDELDEAKTFVYKSFDKFKLYYKDCKETFKLDLEKCKNGNLPDNNRDLFWFLCLDILPMDNTESWKKVITDLRGDYLTSKLNIITKEIDEFILLEEKKGSDKYEVFSNFLKENDFETLDLIKIDVDRTYQDIELFQVMKYKKIMIYVLFVYSKQFPQYGYKQGMSDICAVFLYALYKRYRLTSKFLKDDLTFLYYIIHSNNEFLENDLYILYSNFMNKGLSELYLYTQIKTNNLSKIPLEKKILLTKEEINGYEDSQINKRIYYIFYKLLQKFDIPLYNEMINRVQPELFLFKWYICFLTREFPINKVIHLWDIIFAYDFIQFKLVNKDKKEYHFHFIESIFISMIICCKNTLMKLTDNDSNFMKVLIHYPENIKIENIIKEALKIDSIINPDKGFNLDDIEEQKVENSNYNEIGENKEKKENTDNTNKNEENKEKKENKDNNEIIEDKGNNEIIENKDNNELIENKDNNENNPKKDNK